MEVIILVIYHLLSRIVFYTRYRAALINAVLFFNKVLFFCLLCPSEGSYFTHWMRNGDTSYLKTSTGIISGTLGNTKSKGYKYDGGYVYYTLQPRWPPPFNNPNSNY